MSIIQLRLCAAAATANVENDDDDDDDLIVQWHLVYWMYVLQARGLEFRFLC